MLAGSEFHCSVSSQIIAKARPSDADAITTWNVFLLIDGPTVLSPPRTPHHVATIVEDGTKGTVDGGIAAATSNAI